MWECTEEFKLLTDDQVSSIVVTNLLFQTHGRNQSVHYMDKRYPHAFHMFTFH